MPRKRVSANAASRSDDDAGERQREAFVHDELENIAALGAQRHADADFAGALADEEGDDAVDSDDSEDERERCEGGEQGSDRSWRGGCVGQNRRHGFHFADGRFGIQRSREGAEGLFELRRGGRRAKDERHFGRDAAVFERGAGAVGNVDDAVHEVGSVVAKIVAADVGGDADDGAPVVLPEKAQVFADGVLAGPEAARGFGADDGGARIAGGVGFGEFAAAQKRDAHGAEIAGRDGVEPKERRGLVVGGQVVFDIGRTLGHSAAEWKRVDQRGVADAGKRADFAEEIVIEGKAAAGFAAERFVGRDARGEHVVGTEAGIDVRQRPEAANQQAGAADEQHGEREFADDQDAANAAPGGERGAAAAGFERFGEFGARRLKRRCDAGDDAGEDDEHGGEQENAPVDGDLDEARACLRAART